MGSERAGEGRGAGPGAVFRGPAWPAGTAARWAGLWSLAPRRHAFNGWAWTEAWVASRDSLDLFAPAIGHPDALRGILPLVRDPDGVLRFHGRPECDYADLLAAPDAAPDVLEQALRLLLAERGWKRAELENVREDGILAGALDRLPADLRRLVTVERQAACPAISAAAGPGVFAALAAKDKLRQYHRKLGRLGEVRFRHLESREEIAAHLPRFFRQHEERSVLAGRDSQFRERRPRKFYAELVRAMDPASELRFGLLQAGDRVAAYHFGFEANGRFLFYKPTFDVALWDYSPGQVLLRALFEYAEARHLGIFDFTIGDEEYKHRFANEVVHTLRITVARSAGGASAGRMAGAARAHLRELPGLRALVRKLRGGRTRPPPRAAAVTGYRPGAREGAAGSPPAQRGGLAELAALSLEHPADFPAAAVPDLRLRLKRDELWVARRGNAIVAAAWCGTRDPAALWAGAPESRVITDAWTTPGENGADWVSRMVETAAADRQDALPLLILGSADDLLGRECARRGWARAGRVS